MNSDSMSFDHSEGSPTSQPEDLLRDYIALTADHGRCTQIGDADGANRAHEALIYVLSRLKNISGWYLLMKPLLLHRDASVRCWAASHLVESQLGDASISVLQEISKGNDIIAFNARMVLRGYI